MSEKHGKALITEEWLAAVGFKWHQLERQPNKQWLLWIGSASGNDDSQSLGIEVTKGTGSDWFCWLRSDTAHRYSRFLHVRHIVFRADVINMIEGLTGEEFARSRNRYGAMLTYERALKSKQDSDRLDQVMATQGHPWRDIEKDDTRGGSLPEHMQDSISNGTSK